MPEGNFTWGRAPPPAGLKLYVAPPPSRRRDCLQVVLVPHHHISVRRERLLELHRAEGAHHEDARLAQSSLAQLTRLVSVRHRQPARASGERRAGTLHSPVAVAVGLDDRAQRRAAAQLGAQPRTVAFDRGHVHARLRATRACPPCLGGRPRRAVSHEAPPPRAPRSSVRARQAARRSRPRRSRPPPHPPAAPPPARPARAARPRRRRPRTRPTPVRASPRRRPSTRRPYPRSQAPGFPPGSPPPSHRGRRSACRPPSAPRPRRIARLPSVRAAGARGRSPRFRAPVGVRARPRAESARSVRSLPPGPRADPHAR